MMHVWLINFRFIRDGIQTNSLHCSNAYVNRDRISISGLSNEVPDLRETPLLSIPVLSILPTVTDAANLSHNFALLIERKLVEHVRYFRENYSDVVTRHIKHEFYEEMSRKSETVLSLLP